MAYFHSWYLCSSLIYPLVHATFSCLSLGNFSKPSVLRNYLLLYKTQITPFDSKSFYPIKDIQNDDGIFLTFDVKTGHSASIIFSPKNVLLNPKESYFEVVLGVDKGSHAEIQNISYGEPQSTHDEKNIVSGEEWRKFWIRIAIDGSSIEVGKNRGPTFMSLKTEPRLIKYFGFTSFNVDGAQWAFPSPPSKANILVFI